MTEQEVKKLILDLTQRAFTLYEERTKAIGGVANELHAIAEAIATRAGGE